MEADANPANQRAYPMNPKHAHAVKEEIDKLLKAGFIYEIEHTDWVSPIVIVLKKNGKIRVCVNYKKVNAATKRDNYPLPYTEHMLERVARKEAYSFLDGFSGYNQVQVHSNDRHKTAFATEWGVFAYIVMPFGLTNAPATFQQLMCAIFKDMLRKWLEVFVEDLCVHSNWEEHLEKLRLIFERYRKYGLSLNPLKCQFWVKHGCILGHIVSRNGIATDFSKVRVIVDLPPPVNFKGVQCFLGHTGYYRRFVLNYALIAQPLYKLWIVFEWIKEC